MATTYRWVVQSKKRSDMICTGYTRQNFAKYIPYPIINLFIYYFTKYDYTLQDIKCGVSQQQFESLSFAIQSFKWYSILSIHDSSVVAAKHILLSIHLTFMPPNLNSLQVTFKLHLKETNTTITASSTFTRNSTSFIWPDNTLFLYQLKDLDQLTIEIDIDVLTVQKLGISTITPISQYTNNSNKYYPDIVELPRMRYIWNINDIMTINKIKNSAEHDRIFTSRVFATGSFTWYLSLHRSNENKKHLTFRLTLSSMPDEIISKVAVNVTLSLKQTQTIHGAAMIYDYDHDTCGWPDILLFQQIQDFGDLTFVCDITICDVYDELQNVIQHWIECHSSKYSKAMLLSTTNFEWKISEKKAFHQRFDSPIFTMGNFKWCLELQGDSKESEDKYVYLRLASLPVGVSKITVHYILRLLETDTMHHCSLHFDAECMSTSWAEGTLLISQIKELNELTFRVEITVLECYDLNRNRIENYAEHNKVAFNQLTVLPSVTYQWKINDKGLAEQIKNAPNMTEFSSRIFKIFHLNWCIILTSNGDRSMNKGETGIRIALLSYLPPQISLIIKLSMHVKGPEAYFIRYPVFSNSNKTCGGMAGKLIKNMKNVNGFTIKIDMALIDVYENNEIITQRYMDNAVIPKEINVVPSQQFTWKISRNTLNNMKICGNGVGFESNKFKVYGYQMSLKLYPMGKGLNDIGWVNICICALQSVSSSVSHLAIRYTLVVEELNIKVIDSAEFGIDQSVKSWGDARIETDIFRDLKECTITIQMELIDAYDIHNKIVTDTIKYKIEQEKEEEFDLSLKPKIREIVKTEIESVTKDFVVKLEKLNKSMNVMNDKFNVIIDEMKLMKETMNNQLSIRNNDILDEKKRNEFKSWLYDQVELREYYSIFVENGFDKLSIVKLLTMNELNQMGITKIGHTVKILYEINKLNQIA